MTREERKTYIKAFYATAIYGELEHLVDEVYGDFEAQLKAKESDLERQDMIIKCLSMDLDSKEKLLKSKDEEIKVLECRAYHAEGYISDLHNNPKDKKFYDKKARSIVAMLFWEWRKDKRIYETTSKYKKEKEIVKLYANCSELSFIKAYAMLKTTT